ncbi:phosphoglycerol geranylgeranyltransferase [Halocola ammonii]
MNTVLEKISSLKAKGKKALAVLLDPDKLVDQSKTDKLIEMAHACGVDFFLIGGSLITEAKCEERIKYVHEKSKIPVILFPGSPMQLTPHVDAVLFLSLISGRNPEFLIGHHVVAAPKIKELGLETVATGYMLVDCGKPTTASYMSATPPIPHNKPGIAATTAMAGEMLGLQCLYLDGGSGADKPVSPEMIKAVRSQTKLPLIVGGGLRSADQMDQAYQAGADLLVVGTALEENPELLFEVSRTH